MAAEAVAQAVEAMATVERVGSVAEAVALEMEAALGRSSPEDCQGAP